MAAAAQGLLQRSLWVVVHRWAGLTLALFLGVAGLTGSLLPWIEELEMATAPQLHASDWRGTTDPLRVREDVLARYPGAAVDFLPLSVEPGKALRLHLHWLDPATGLEREPGPGVPDWDDLFLNPVTGAEQGRREWGAISQGIKNLVPFIYRLHFSLALGTIGTPAFGIAALVWTLDCFVGFWLTLPPARQQPASAPFLERWRPSWRVRWRAARWKLNFDLHRAGGLWLWPMLLVFAWSSVSFNLPQVHIPVMQALGGRDARMVLVEAALPAPRHQPRLDFRAAAARGSALAAEEAAKRGLAVEGARERWLWHVPASGLYVYGFTTAADITRHGGGSRVAFDSNTGELRAAEWPSGENGVNTFSNWLTALHMAQVLGLPYRVFVSVLGLAVTMLAVTGVVIWLKKRSARADRVLRKERNPPQVAH